MVRSGLPLLRHVLAGVLAAIVLVVGPEPGAPPAVSLPTPTAVVVSADHAPSVQITPLPHAFWGSSSVPLRQIASVPVLTASQAAALPVADDLVIVEARPDDVWRARRQAAGAWATRTANLQWSPATWVVVLFGGLLAGLLGTRRWTARAMSVITLGVAAVALSTASVWLPAMLFLALPLAWLVADVAFVLGMFAWAEARIAATPVRRPAGQPTPLPVANR